MTQYFKNKKTGQVGGMFEDPVYTKFDLFAKEDVKSEVEIKVWFWRLHSGGLVSVLSPKDIDISEWEEISHKEYMNTGTRKDYNFNTQLTNAKETYTMKEEIKKLLTREITAVLSETNGRPPVLKVDPDGLHFAIDKLSTEIAEKINAQKHELETEKKCSDHWCYIIGIRNSEIEMLETEIKKFEAESSKSKFRRIINILKK